MASVALLLYSALLLASHRGGVSGVRTSNFEDLEEFRDEPDGNLQVPTSSSTWLAKALDDCRGVVGPSVEEPEPECGSAKECYDRKAKEWLKKMAQKTKCDYLRRPKEPCGQALEGKWRGKWWWGIFKGIGETVWSDVSMNETFAGLDPTAAHMDSVTTRYSWSDLFARWVGEKVGSERAQSVGIKKEAIVQWEGVSPGSVASLQLARERYDQMLSVDLSGVMESGGSGDFNDDDGSASKPVCIVERSDKDAATGQRKQTYGIVYKVSAISGAQWLEEEEAGEERQSGEVAVKEHKGGAVGQVPPGKLLKILWFDPDKIREKYEADVVESEWTKVLAPLGVMPLNEEQRRVRVLRLVIDKLLSHVEIIKSGGQWGPSWLRSWSAYCTFTCMSRWMKVFYYSWKINYETQNVMKLAQRQSGFLPSQLAGKNFQTRILNELDVTSTDGMEKLGSLMKRGLWKFMSSMVETVDNNVFFRTQIFFFHSIKQMIIGWIARILGVDDLTMACKWKKILGIMETHENYTRHNPNFWLTFTAWCPGWTEQMEPSQLTRRAFEWVYNNTAFIGEAIGKSWLARKTQQALEAVIRKIHAAFKTGSQVVMHGVMTAVDSVLINRLMSMGVIDEEEKKMMEAKNAPPPYPGMNTKVSDETAMGCVSYYTTKWIVPRTRITWRNSKVLKGEFKFDEDWDGKMRIRSGSLDEGVLEMRRADQCEDLDFLKNVKRLFNKVAGAANVLHVLPLAEVSEVVEIGTDVVGQGSRLAAAALSQKTFLERCGEGDEQEPGIDPEARLCRLLRSKWQNLPQAKNEGVCESVVEGSEHRNSFWRRKNDVCKCPKTFPIIAGGANCTGNGRYFDPATLAGRDCRCENEEGGFAPVIRDPSKPTIRTKPGFEGYQYCLLMLFQADDGWENHVMCSQTRSQAEGWKAALDLHRYAYGKEDRTVENEFSKLLGEELDGAQVTVEEIMTRHTAVTAGEGAGNETVKMQAGAQAVTERMRELQASLENGGGEGNSFVEVSASMAEKQRQLSALGAQLGRASMAVDAAVAKFAGGFDLVARDSKDIHRALGVFQEVFLEAHAHVTLLHAHGASVVSYYCKTGDEMFETYTSASYFPGDCIKSYEYNSYTHGSNWVSCYNVYDCDAALYDNAMYDSTCMWGGCAYQITYDAEMMIQSDMYYGGGGAAGCFPSNALVEVPGIHGASPIFREIHNIRVGDWVRGNAGFERVFAVTQHDPDARSMATRLVMHVQGDKPGDPTDGAIAVLELTANHLIPVGRDGELRRADVVRVGDFLHLSDGKIGYVMSTVEVRAEGHHSVKTPSGLLAVRAPGSALAALASTTADVGQPLWMQRAHTWLEAPLQAVSWVAPSLVDVGGPMQRGVELYERGALRFRRGKGSRASESVVDQVLEIFA